MNFPANNFTRTYSVLLAQSLWNSFTWSKMIGHRLHNLHDELLRMQTALRAHLIQLFIKFRSLWKWIPEGLRQKNRVSSCKVICRKVHQFNKVSSLLIKGHRKISIGRTGRQQERKTPPKSVPTSCMTHLPLHDMGIKQPFIVIFMAHLILQH